jgi:Zinc finger, C3HC4 type (RING finger)
MAYFSPITDGPEDLLEDNFIGGCDLNEFPAVTYTLPPEWEAFSAEFKKLKDLHIKTSIEIFEDRIELCRREGLISDARKVLLSEMSEKLKDEYKSFYERFEADLDITGLTAKICELTGKKQALENILELKVPRSMCPVCFENEIATFYDPCGHTLCKTCSDKANQNKCPMCRTAYKKICRLFIN